VKTPSYYTVVPAPVRYDSQLTFFEIVLYGELVALSNVKGYSWVTNKALATLYQKSLSTIEKAISNLKKQGHIHVVIHKEQGNKRYIFIGQETPEPPPVKNEETPPVKNYGSYPINNKNQKVFNTKVNKQPKTSYKNNYKKELPQDIKVEWLEDYIKQVNES